MRTIPAGFLDTHVTTLQVCWVVVRRDGEIIRGTECDEDIEISTGSDYAGTYLAQAGITGSAIRSTDDLAVDNLEVTGALQEISEQDSSSATGILYLDLSAADIEAGVFDNAEVTTFLVNTLTPDLYQHVLRTGWLGNVTRTAEGQYQTELRGLTQALSQGIVRTYSVACDAELFDARCRVDPAAFTTTDTVTAVTSRRVFQAAGPFPGLSAGGKITFTSGGNNGYAMEIKSISGTTITLYLPMPADITIGDTFTYRSGCDKASSTCIGTYNNFLNFRGHGLLVPGDTEILKVGKK
jgi:uncharacterized phage protein (TIGR02218 family)